MKVAALSFCLAGAVCFLASSEASAQPYSPFAQTSPYAPPGYTGYARPALSPYLNLLRGGNPAANYYLGVLPEFQRRANAYQFGAAIQDLEQRTATLSEPSDQPLELTSGTGHPTAFGNTGNYFGVAPSQRYLPPAAPQAAGRRTR